jgi:hypothetical protein
MKLKIIKNVEADLCCFKEVLAEMKYARFFFEEDDSQPSSSAV